MQHRLPMGNYQWMTEKEIANFDIFSQHFESDVGHVFSVTLSYPEKYHLDHSSLPLAATHIMTEYEDLSPYSKQCLEELQLKYVPVKKLSSTFETRRNYVCLGMNLKLYLELGMVLEKIHFGIKFQQGDYMANYVEAQSRARRNAVTKIESLIAKKLVNSCFGKMIEGSSKRFDLRFARSRERCLQINTDPRFSGFKICGDNLVVELLRKKQVDLRRHWMIGFAILELSKYVMSSIYYKVIQPTFDKQASIIFSDTDSYALLLPVASADEACRMLSPIMDFSNLDPCHPLYSDKLKNVAGFLKNETPSARILKMCALKAKTYAYVTEQDLNASKATQAKCKGVKKSARDKLRFEHYKQCIISPKVQTITQFSINSKNHCNRLVKVTKRAFSSMEDKRWYLCPRHSVPYGSVLIKRFKEANNECFFCKNPHILR